LHIAIVWRSVVPSPTIDPLSLSIIAVQIR
jgi:hypothetical protein